MGSYWLTGLFSAEVYELYYDHSGYPVENRLLRECREQPGRSVRRLLQQPRGEVVVACIIVALHVD